MLRCCELRFESRKDASRAPSSCDPADAEANAALSPSSAIGVAIDPSPPDAGPCPSSPPSSSGSTEASIPQVPQLRLATSAPAANRSVAETPAPATDRPTAILLALAQAGEGRIAFGGLRRSLGLHQEVLSRSLQRLVRDGLVERTSEGYRLTDRGFSSLQGRTLPREAGHHLTVIHALLPPDVPAEAAAAKLEGRWFQGLRWYGKAEGPGEVTLTWLLDTKTRARRAERPASLSVQISGGSVTVDIQGEDVKGTAFRALRPLVQAVSELYAPPAPYGANSEANGPGIAG